MRNAVKLTAVLLVLVCPQMGSAQPTQYSWHPIGLQGGNVNCLLVDDTVRMLAGTDRGLWLRDADWIQFSGGIATNASVKAMVRLSSGDIIAAVGGGSNSDGVYRGVDILDGPPFYEFSLVEHLTGAQALAVGVAAYLTKLAIGGFLLAVFETAVAKMRVFRVPEFLGAALMLGLLATLLLFVSRSL